MRTIRLFLSLLISLVLVTYLLVLGISSEPDSPLNDGEPEEPRHGLGSYFYFRSPASLFTPAATISLTDDNSTAFAAWPAAFGPLLPVRGLSGEIWIGSGFGVDNLGRSGIAAGVEGELGCSDIPGWTDHDWRPSSAIYSTTKHLDQSTKSSKNSRTHSGSKTTMTKRDSPSPDGDQQPQNLHTSSKVDGTDEHLQFPLPGTTIVRRRECKEHKSKNGLLEHADIQSLQESAEIAGKVVILSRGGCGFSEKVKWAQRRGATAVIIGDNVLGGPLVRMYARGDTSNITIPSLFTSHTTAHLLSSLIPTGFETEGSSSSPLWKWPSSSASDPYRNRPESSRNQNSKTLPQSPDVPLNSGSSNQAQSPKSSSARTEQDSSVSLSDVPKEGWLRSSLSAVGLRKDSSQDQGGKDSRRPPSSGQLLWPGGDRDGSVARTGKLVVGATKQTPKGFVIGVQDWRDRDVVRADEDFEQIGSSSTQNTVSKPTTGPHSILSPLKGGSITPGSGEYERPNQGVENSQKVRRDQATSATVTKPTSENEIVDAESWLSLVAWKGDDTHANGANDGAKNPSSASGENPVQRPTKQQSTPANDEASRHRDGLWVTLTPTDINANPFFNTLFVLVISPLITLAIVYSMLLLRSRIRRRRWRAPKSLVERLPVHVYHTTSRSSSRSTTEDEDPTTAPTTATTPLLAEARPAELVARPRSRTICGPSASLPSSSRYGSLEPSSIEQEKVLTGLAEWKRKYRGKQVECVVCLEEYVDGVSKVMSLPCGHEFHVDCITPWLTTRRRTCPICKGDVVRSMARATEDSTQSTDNMTEDEIQEQAAEGTNDSPSSALPIARSGYSDDVDLERADVQDAGEGSASWISRGLSRGIGYLGRQDQAAAERDR